MIELFNTDCMKLMARYPDQFFHLAIVDPPYGGKDIADFTPRAKGTTKNKIHKNTTWNNERPSKEYFSELFRVSKNQIIWGGNYFSDYLPPSRGWIFWDKLYENTNNFSAGELAFTSFDKILKMTRISQRWIPGTELNIHPTQKPVKLYEWVLTNYSNPKELILDTHLGSGSIALACHNLGYDMVAAEISEEYYDAAKKRLEEHKRQGKMVFV